MAKLTRRESREIAFTLLFEWSFQDDTIDEIIENAVMARGIVIDTFARKLVDKVIENRKELDLLIERYSQGWKLQRISKTALAVLRMSFCELTKFDDIPVGASINEAVELVKKFGTDEEAAYLNGILGNFEKVRKGQRKEPPLPKKEEAGTIESRDSNIQEDHNEHNEQAIQKEHDVEHNDVELVEDIIIEVE